MQFHTSTEGEVSSLSRIIRKYAPYLALAAPILGGYFGLKYASRKLVASEVARASKILLTDSYDENMWELVSAGKRSGAQTIIENSLRAQTGRAIDRPLGSPKAFPSMDDLMFNMAQIDTMPTPDQAQIDLTTFIGKKAVKPLQLTMPIMISAMAYGVALSEPFKIALAKGAALAGIASNTGEGPFLPKEREAAQQLILQYNRGYWNKEPEILQQADMIELQFGQGATGGTSHTLAAKEMRPLLRKRFGVTEHQSVTAHSRIPGINSGQDLIRTVKELRKITGGIPIAAKIGAGKYLEKDLDWLLAAEVDVICIDGAEAATKGSHPILQDDFGVPTLFALSRAVDYLEKTRARKQVDLVISGGLRTPGHFLKAIALGADAVYIGSAALYATAELQSWKALPFEPPTQVAWESGRYADKFDIEQGARSLYKFLMAVSDEIKAGLQALGKRSLRELSKEDLMALSGEIAQALGVTPVYQPCQ